MNRVLAAVLAVVVLLAIGLSVSSVLRPDGPPAQPVPTLPPGAALRGTPTSGPQASVRTVGPLPTVPPTPGPGVQSRVQLFNISSALKPKTQPNVVDSLPNVRLIPDSEVVYGIGAVEFDTKGFLAARPGYINQYNERILNGEVLSGPEIVERVAQQFSVHPRLLIALLEFEGGWVNSPTVTAIQRQRPLGNMDAIRNGKLYLQLTWAASMLNQGYYGMRLGTRTAAQMGDRDAYASFPPGTNAGTAAVLNFLAAITPRAEWDDAMGTGSKSFAATYKALFGDPFANDKGAPINNNVRQPALRLPWAPGERWHLTGGPHNSWGGGSNWGALDFTPVGGGGCGTMPDWVTSMSDGYVVRSQSGEVMVSLDPSRDERRGWAILYMHIGTQGRVAEGTQLKPGDRIGHPSCEGGQAIAAHLHVARKYNGEWVSAAGDIPFVMDGFVAYETPGGEFQGALVRGEVVRVADESRNIEVNGVP